MASLAAFNRWLEEDWGFSYRDRLIAVPMLSLADPDAALGELSSLIERGARMVHIRPAPVPGPNGTGRSLGDKLHDPVWARLAEASLPVAFHLGDSGYNAFAAAWGASATCDGDGALDVLSRVSSRPRRSTTRWRADRRRRLPSPPRVAGRERRERSDWCTTQSRKQANQTPWIFHEILLDTCAGILADAVLEEDLRALPI
jgi:hypothetical protein